MLHNRRVDSDKPHLGHMEDYGVYTAIDKVCDGQ